MHSFLVAFGRTKCQTKFGRACRLSGTVAVGTETDGSIISPSTVCGIVGIKPTVGLVARSGIIPISHTQDTAGPMARTVTDAAILLGIPAFHRKPGAIRFMSGIPRSPLQ